MQAVVMAGGVGSRLRPLTIGRPKPLVPLINKPVIGHIRDLLTHHGVADMAVTVQYLADAIKDYLGDGADRGCPVSYAIEEMPLGTAGGVKNAAPFLHETFIVLSGDALTDLDLESAFRFHAERGALATVILYHVPNPLEYGVVITARDGRIRAFQEKPSWGEVISDTVNTGIYILEPEVLEEIPAGVPFDFSKDLFPRLLERGAPLYGLALDGYWTDIGDLREYRRACADILRGEVRLTEPIGERIGANVFARSDVAIDRSAQLYGPVFLGEGVKVHDGVVIHGPTAIGDYCAIDSRAHLDRSILWGNDYVGDGAEVRGAVVQSGCNVKRRAVLFEGVVLGDNCTVGEAAVLHPDVLLWPNKEVEGGATVKRSLIWGSQARSTLFGRFGVTGLVNIDLTPEFAARLGAAFASTMPKGARVVINRDPHRSPRMLKRAIISGMPSAGVNAWDTRSVPIPVARHFIRVSRAAGGVHVRLSPFDTRVVDIRFYDSDGLDLSKAHERRIEQAFYREDFRRVYLDDIGTISYAPDVVERYAEDFLAVLDSAAVRGRGFRVVVDYANAPTAEVVPTLLGQLGCDVVALNANVDENRMSVSRLELEDELRRLAAITRAVEADLAVRFDVAGEKLYVVDDRGRAVKPDRLAAALADLIWLRDAGAIVGVPVNAPGMFEILAERRGGQVVRTGVGLDHLARAATASGVALVADSTGYVVMPALLPAPDGMFAFARLLEFLAQQQGRLSDLLDALPRWHTTARTVSCPWESKGVVMRRLHEEYRSTSSAQVDGVRVNVGDDWVLVLPDPDQPIFHVYGDSASEQQADTLAERYARIVETLQA
jgi:mannose-1-phosphate guanylyltransferase/phosphomannomutase